MPPLAVRLAEFPGQIPGAAGLILITGNAYTVTLTAAESIKPFGPVTVTLYLVVTTGVMVIESAVEPVLH